MLLLVLKLCTKLMRCLQVEEDIRYLKHIPRNSLPLRASTHVSAASYNAARSSVILYFFFSFLDTKYIAAAPAYFAVSFSVKLKLPAIKREVYKIKQSKNNTLLLSIRTDSRNIYRLSRLWKFSTKTNKSNQLKYCIQVQLFFFFFQIDNKQCSIILHDFFPKDISWRLLMQTHGKSSMTMLEENSPVCQKHKQ